MIHKMSHIKNKTRTRYTSMQSSGSVVFNLRKKPIVLIVFVPDEDYSRNASCSLTKTVPKNCARHNVSVNELSVGYHLRFH